MSGLWLLFGALVGAVNGLTRWWTVTQLRAEMSHSPLLMALGGMTLRLALVAALLMCGLRQGIVPGLLAFAGLWLARSGAVIWFQVSGRSWPTDSGSPDNVAGQHSRPTKR